MSSASPGAKPFNILFLCTGNSARSILAEALMNAENPARFRGYSAGSFPKGEVHPLALDLLRREGLPLDGLRSKSWEEFSAPGAPQMDFIFTVCDNAANEPCPIWPGHPMTAHWGLPDPAAVEGEETMRRLAFAETLRALRNRIRIFASLPLQSLDAMSLRNRLAEIGRQ
ncbi:arsenate reductase ArsC [Ferrovibrio sp.]|uniref:arsenate reductase ArsC n=1 Tax=Ferrovibrio sp. TaxID=1917215 RepID=UPI0025C27DA5|nr:arsenate reductase ArsC [Ferrovibrio sp.]MBX3455160.1 arsenate reductase ArsC [Ferrovibrio sp.]